MEKDKFIEGYVYFLAENNLDEVTEKIGTMLHCDLSPPDDEDWEIRREGFILASKTALINLSENKFMFYITRYRRVSSSIPEKIQIEHYLHTLLRHNGFKKIITEKYKRDFTVEEDNYELSVDYHFKNSNDLEQLKPILDDLFMSSFDITEKDGKKALSLNALGSIFYITQAGSESGSFNYHISCEFAYPKEGEFKQINISSYFDSLFRYHELSE